MAPFLNPNGPTPPIWPWQSATYGGCDATTPDLVCVCGDSNQRTVTVEIVIQASLIRRTTMKELEPVIQVREIPPVCRSQRPYLPSLRDLVSETPHADESRILSYLGQG